MLIRKKAKIGRFVKIGIQERYHKTRHTHAKNKGHAMKRLKRKKGNGEDARRTRKNELATRNDNP